MRYRPTNTNPDHPALGAKAPSEDLPDWLTAFIHEAQRETDTLRENGADQAAAARSALLTKLLAAAHAWLNEELDAGEAAHEQGVSAETIRRAVRGGRLPDRRPRPKGRHRVRRGDLTQIAGPASPPYDPTADAQSIAQLRRTL